jgi:hypothetical protein
MAVAQTTSKRLETLKEWFAGDAELNAEWIRRARKAWQFYTGIQQWDPWVVASLKVQQRPFLTINRILSTVHVPCGYQRRNRADLKLYPRRGGTQPVAELGTALLKHTMDISGGTYEESDMFLDGVVTGVGWLFAYPDYQDDPVNGDLKVVKESTFDVMADQTNQHYDINRGRRIWRTSWQDKRYVILHWGKSESALDEAMEAPEWYDDQYDEIGEMPWQADVFEMAWDRYGLAAPRMDGTDLLKKTHYRIRECWYKTAEKIPYLLRAGSRMATRLSPEQAKQTAEILLISDEANQQFRIIEQVGDVLHRCLHVGDLELEYEKDPLRGVTLFPFARFMPYLADGYAFGIVENTIGLQEELNKRRSVALHNANQTANSGWFVGDSSNAEAMDKLAKFGSKPGVVLDASQYGGRLEKIDPSKPDTANMAMAEMAANDIKEVSGINDDLTGTNARASESGRARAIRQEAGLTSAEIVFDHLDQTEMHLGNLLWEIIRRGETYTEEEIAAVVTEGSLKHFIRADALTRQQVLDLSPMRNWQTGRYGVQVDRWANSPTMRMSQFEQVLDTVKAGVPIPPEMIAEMSDWPNKEVIIEEIKRQREMQAQMQAAGAAGPALPAGGGA